MGHTATAVLRMFTGTQLVERQSSYVERQEYTSSDTSTNNLRGCERHRMGMQFTTSESNTTNSLWTLESPRSIDVDQLERTSSSISGSTNLSQSQQYANFNSYRQHHLNGVHEQTRRDQIPTFDGIGDSTLEMVPSERHHHSVHTHSRNSQPSGRLRITAPISEEQLDDSTFDLSTTSDTVGRKRRRPFCGPNHNTTSKIRVVASGSSQPSPRRIYNFLETVSPSIFESSVEPYQPMPPETTRGESSTMHANHSLVALSNMVSSGTSTEYPSTSSSSSLIHQFAYTSSNVANEKQVLETRRMEALMHKYTDSTLNSAAKHILSQHRLSNSSTNQSYKRGQLLFIQWCDEHQVVPQSFTPSDLVNFLSDMHSTYTYAVSTLQLFRSAITHFNQDPNSLRTSDLVNTFITTLLHQAPPIKLHRPTISLQPTVQYLCSLDHQTISLISVQQKLVFLLGITCFLRPSDLHRIPFASVQVSTTGSSLSFEVHCPKEKRNRRHIIKSHSDSRMCPVETFRLFVQRRPNTIATKPFVNSLRPNHPLQCRTIQSWISTLIQRSTSEKRVSLRSIGSSLALASGIPKEDVVTMGNWTNSITFENHYRREHLSNFDFTNTLVEILDQNQDDDSEDIFHDAMDTLD